ncbi:hypothetical protein V1512DRAFT_265654 [Lipomyces arxii]|uniref:uncharacterized protein n=1 Tax=Lipomyces arxii TaxID=56418 RepID=UPI0034CEB216
MRRSQFCQVLLPSVVSLHVILLLPLLLPTHGVNVSWIIMMSSIGLGLVGFGVLVLFRLFLTLFPVVNIIATCFLLFVIGFGEEVVHFILVKAVSNGIWHPAYILGYAWAVAECTVSLYQLVPPKQYRYIHLPTGEDGDEDDEYALDHDEDTQTTTHPDPAATFASAAAVHQRQREDPIAPLVGTSLLDLPTYFPFLWRASAILHHLGFSILLSFATDGPAMLGLVLSIAFYRGIMRSVWGVGIIRFGVVTVTFLNLLGGLLSLVVGLALWRAI